MWTGWMKYGGIELVNQPRTIAYMQALRPSAGVADPCPCPPLEAAIPGDWTIPSRDNAPWVQADDPASAGFAGLVVLGVKGLDDAALAPRPVTDSPAGGGSLGRLVAGPKVLTVRAALMGATEAALAAGRNWLGSVLDGSNQASQADCQLGTLEWFEACPTVTEPCVDVDTLYWIEFEPSPAGWPIRVGETFGYNAGLLGDPCVFHETQTVAYSFPDAFATVDRLGVPPTGSRRAVSGVQPSIARPEPSSLTWAAFPAGDGPTGEFIATGNARQVFEFRPTPDAAEATFTHTVVGNMQLDFAPWGRGEGYDLGIGAYNELTGAPIRVVAFNVGASLQDAVSMRGSFDEQWVHVDQGLATNWFGQDHLQVTFATDGIAQENVRILMWGTRDQVFQSVVLPNARNVTMNFRTWDAIPPAQVLWRRANGTTIPTSPLGGATHYADLVRVAQAMTAADPQGNRWTASRSGITSTMPAAEASLYGNLSVNGVIDAVDSFSTGSSWECRTIGDAAELAAWIAAIEPNDLTWSVTPRGVVTASTPNLAIAQLYSGIGLLTENNTPGNPASIPARVRVDDGIIRLTADGMRRSLRRVGLISGPRVLARHGNCDTWIEEVEWQMTAENPAVYGAPLVLSAGQAFTVAGRGEWTTLATYPNFVETFNPVCYPPAVTPADIAVAPCYTRPVFVGTRTLTIVNPSTFQPMILTVAITTGTTPLDDVKLMLLERRPGDPPFPDATIATTAAVRGFYENERLLAAIEIPEQPARSTLTIDGPNQETILRLAGGTELVAGRFVSGNDGGRLVPLIVPPGATCALVAMYDGIWNPDSGQTWAVTAWHELSPR